MIVKKIKEKFLEFSYEFVDMSMDNDIYKAFSHTISIFFILLSILISVLLIAGSIPGSNYIMIRLTTLIVGGIITAIMSFNYDKIGMFKASASSPIAIVLFFNVWDLGVTSNKSLIAVCIFSSLLALSLIASKKKQIP